MPKQKQPKAKYSKGDKVYSSMEHNKSLTVKEEPEWNGHTWMYSFEETNMRCGEGYLSDLVFIKAYSSNRKSYES